MLTAGLVFAFGLIYSLIPNTQGNFALKLFEAVYMVSFLRLCAFLAFVCFVAGAAYKYLLSMGRTPGALMGIHRTCTIITTFVAASLAFTLTRGMLLENVDLQITFLIVTTLFFLSQALYILILIREI